MAQSSSKVCSKCKQEKPATPKHFARNRTKEDGLQTECRPCRKLLVDPALQKYRSQAAKSAARRNKPWTPEDIKVALDPDLTISEAAARLGRTFGAVAMRRNREKQK